MPNFEMREYFIENFQQRVIYHVGEATIRVVAIVHASRQGWSWHRRLDATRTRTLPGGDMNTRTSTEQDTDEAQFRDDLIERALKLSIKERNGLSLLIVKELGDGFEHLEAEQQEWRDEIARRTTGVSPVADPETCVTPELMEKVAKLTDDGREWLEDALIGPPDEPEGTPEEIRRSHREEMHRRIDAIRRGETKTYTIEETLAYLDSLCRPESS